jgi:murein DD-endopeptidase MepM/ murein hydrolase activator NlpD
MPSVQAYVTPGKAEQPDPTVVGQADETATPASSALTDTALASASITSAPKGAGPSPSATTTRPPSSPSAQPVLPSRTPSPVPMATAEANEAVVIGQSALGQPLVAYRVGKGPIKVVLVGDIHGAYETNTYALAQELLHYFQSQPDEVPGRVSLWIVPILNPDGLAAGTRWNSRGVDLNRNADTDLDGCAGNDWSRDTVGNEGTYPGAGGAFPFSEPEARALRDFLTDAQVVVFYHSAVGAIYADSCQRHLPSARLAEILSEGTGYPVPSEGWTGYRITGDFVDYLAGEGVAAVAVELTDHEGSEVDRNLEGVRLLLAGVDRITAAEVAASGGELVWLDESGLCAWQYPDGSLIHPLALEVISDTAYLLDTGRVLAVDLGAGPSGPTCELLPKGTSYPLPRVLLAPGDSVAGVPVIEPLDLATSAAPASSQPSLLVLDRAGDVYSYDPATASWALERYGRPSLDTGDHYYVALSAWEGERFLLETTHEKVWRFAQGQVGSAWADLPLGRDVDLSATQDAVYVLTRALSTPVGDLVRYPRGAGARSEKPKATASFEPGIALMQPRQVVGTGSGILVLDRAGRRLLALDPTSGALRTEYAFTDRRPVSALWASPGPSHSGQPVQPGLILAGRDALYFYPTSPTPGSGREDSRGEAVDNAQAGALPNDAGWLESLRGLSMPIQGATITRRDFQMPGAPRHYRLGVHEGIDFYASTSGTPIGLGTPVRAVAGGTVVRALWSYQPLTASQAKAWSARVREEGYTPPDVLDGYRGRQVWIEHENGLVSRYAHLSAIAPGIVEGAKVEQGQVIGLVGNSGTPESVSNPKGEMHLHLELWAGQYHIGQFLRPIEAREWIERILR